MYKLGALPNPPDVRDWVAMTKPVALPDEAIKPCVYPNDDQEHGNCVMQAIRTAFREFYDAKFGVSFGYGYYREHDGPGMYPRTAYQGVKTYGIPKLPDDPREYEVIEVINYARQNASTLLPKSEEYKGWTYYALTTVDAVKSALVDSLTTPGMRVTATLRVETYEKRKNGFWRCAQATQGYHRIMLLGYGKHEGIEGVKIRNSWGNWGDAWVTWDDLMGAGDIMLHVPPEKLEPKPEPKNTVLRRTLRLKTPYMRDGGGYTDVSEAQTKLTKHGFPVGAIDGVFGKQSDAATKAFQRAMGLVSDGIIGAKTWAELDKEPDKKKRLEALLKLMVGDYYIIGGQGHELTQEYLKQRKDASPNYFTNGRYEWLSEQVRLANSLGKKLYCEDCSGLFMKANEVLGILPFKDLTANGLWGQCEQISRADVKAGDLLFRDSDGVKVHVAVVGYEGVYEAAGTEYGVVKREAVDDRQTISRMTGKIDTLKAWTHFGRLKGGYDG